MGHELSSSEVIEILESTEPDIEPNEHEMADPECNAEALND